MLKPQGRLAVAFLFCWPLALGAAGCSCESGTPSRMDMGGGDDMGPRDLGMDPDMEVGDPCEDEPCLENQVCVRSGGSYRCDADCTGVTCDPGYGCRDVSGVPTCVLDCTGFPCPSGQTCSAASGAPTCVTGCTETCGLGQRCATVDDDFVCVDNTCADLACTSTEVCEPAAGGGFVCRDNSCTGDLECDPSENCVGGVCIGDTCTPGVRSCSGNQVLECLGNGSGTFVRLECSQACSDASGEASCPCADDWDCPANTECVVDRCVGTGVAPTCFLAPQPFTSVLPTNEITWGGTQTNRNAVGSPFPASAQAVIAPLVINLDDDNGDGAINELDFPEIVFASFCDAITGGGNRYEQHGVLRAIHGGGPNKGDDFFASCGNNVWAEGEPTTAFDAACSCTAGIIDPTGSLAAGDLDNDGVPEIVAIHETDELLIYSNRGALISSFDTALDGGNPAVSIANVDGAGFAEIIVGRRVFTLEHSGTGVLQVRDVFAGTGTGGTGTNSQGSISCVADILGDGRLEVIAGSTAYEFPNPPPGVTRRSECMGTQTDPDYIAFCAGQLRTRWDARTIDSRAVRQGFCAVADVLGLDQTMAPGPGNPLDQIPEVITIAAGRLQVFNGQTGQIYVDMDIPGGNGGAPNVDDFDGDGFPEIGTAGATEYQMIDLQPATAECPAWPATIVDDMPFPAANLARDPNQVPCSVDADCGFPGEAVCNTRAGTCTCLHNGWTRRTEDDSSEVTGSTLFDFNGDGAAEVVYNDECYFRVYDGRDGTVYFREPSESRTRIEYPIVADADNDGNAEIIFSTTNESGFCSVTGNRPSFNNGIEMWGDAGDFWVSARRVWNQHAYHVTNVYEGGSVPMSEPPSWESLNGRLYNSYRSNPQSPFGIAPDLQITGLQVSSPDVACGTFSLEVDLAARVVNAGDLRVGPGIAVTFFGTWSGVESPLMTDSGPLSVALATSLEAGGEVFLVARYDATGRTPSGLPDSVRAVIDGGNVERECREANNDLTATLTTGASEADLRLTIGGATGDCPTKMVSFTVFNDGSAPVVDPVVRFFGGNPMAGGVLISTVTVTGTVPAGGQLASQATITAPRANFQLYGVVDPDDMVPECNDGNNLASLPAFIDCTGFE